jgi:hypothetical protein
MASIPQIRGALLEEIVLFLLARSGYRRVVVGEEGTHNGNAGMEVDGRGSQHQIDALVAPLYSYTFVYPIRLMVEAKCQARPVGLATVRSVVGTVTDINQNYFVAPVRRGREIRGQRFNYHAAIFAANGYSDDAERYAIAHQVFLIDYTHVASLRPVVDVLLTLGFEDFGEPARVRRKHGLKDIRNGFRDVIEREQIDEFPRVFSRQGAEKIRDRLVPAIRQLHGSYYGMIEGLYPVHLVSRREIPLRFIAEQAEVRCEIRVSDDDQTWAFEPAGIPRESPDFFHLEFAIPDFVADMLGARERADQIPEDMPHWHQVAEVKRRYMRFIDVTAIVQHRLVGFRLTLDVDWLDRYVQQRQIIDRLNDR